MDLMIFKVNMHGNAYILSCGNNAIVWRLGSLVTRIETVSRPYAEAQLASPFLNVNSIITRTKLIGCLLHQIIESIKYKGSIVMRMVGSD